MQVAPADKLVSGPEAHRTSTFHAELSSSNSINNSDCQRRSEYEFITFKVYCRPITSNFSNLQSRKVNDTMRRIGQIIFELNRCKLSH